MAPQLAFAADAAACVQRGGAGQPSNNLVLAPLLAHRLDAFAIARDAGPGLALAPGVLAETNGLTLLGAQGFDPKVQGSAGKVSRWLSGYLAHPAEGVDVLVESARVSASVSAACPCRSLRGSRP